MELELIGRLKINLIGKPFQHKDTTHMNAISPSKLLIESGLDWNANKVSTYFRDPVSGEERPTGKQALIRSTDSAVLCPSVGKEWQPVQNSAALAFFEEFCSAGSMHMESAGALANGRYVYAYSKIDEAFELPGGDLVEARMLFCNPHIVGKSVNIFFTPRRFICLNQLPMLFCTSSGRFRCLHTATFDPEEAKQALGLSKGMFAEFKQQSEFLASRRFTNPQLEQYFMGLFPNGGSVANENGMSRRAMLCVANLESQPGADMSAGSWWHAFNTVTYVADHVLGRSEDTRSANALFGWTRQRKQEALQLALKMAA